MKLLSDWLKRRPLESCGLQRRQADTGQARVTAEIRDLGKRDLPGPNVAWQGMLRWHPCLRKPAVPLCPHGVFTVGEVKALDDRSALPAIVRGICRFVEDVSTGGYLAPPRAGLWRRVNVEQLARAR
jgi:hypothetical protein